MHVDAPTCGTDLSQPRIPRYRARTRIKQETARVVPHSHCSRSGRRRGILFHASSTWLAATAWVPPKCKTMCSSRKAPTTSSSSSLSVSRVLAGRKKTGARSAVPVRRRRRRRHLSGVSSRRELVRTGVPARRVSADTFSGRRCRLGSSPVASFLCGCTGTACTGDRRRAPSRFRYFFATEQVPTQSRRYVVVVGRRLALPVTGGW